MTSRYIWGAALTLILLAACSHGGSTVSNDQFAFLDSLGITVTDQLLLGDSLTMPDVYCGDPNQQFSDLK